VSHPASTGQHTQEVARELGVSVEANPSKAAQSDA